MFERRLRKPQRGLQASLTLAVLLGFTFVLWSHPHPKLSLPSPLQVYNLPRLQWTNDISTSEQVAGRLPETTRPVESSYGFYLFDHLYVWRGTIYAVTSQNLTQAFPDRTHILTRAVNLENVEEATDEDFQFITPEKARKLFKTPPMLMEGTSFMFIDSPQFMPHFYHWWGEILLGALRAYSTLTLSPTYFEFGDAFSLPLPSRFILSSVYGAEWRDHAGLIAPLMFAAFPKAPIHQGEWWDDLARTEIPLLFERVLVESRVAAHRHPLAGRWFKMVGSVMGQEVPEQFFEPIRQNIARSFFGHVPIPPSEVLGSRPVVTYISRQSHGRRLTDEAHQSLVQALRALEDEGVCEVNVAEMQTMSVVEQVKLASRTTIILGVHGNGLTHQLWMPPSEMSTLIEIVQPTGYNFDYEIISRNLGHKHYAIWNDTYRTWPVGQTHEGVHSPEGFHGDSIPVYGLTVADVVRQRLSVGSKAKRVEEG